MLYNLRYYIVLIRYYTYLTCLTRQLRETR